MLPLHHRLNRYDARTPEFLPTRQAYPLKDLSICLNMMGGFHHALASRSNKVRKGKFLQYQRVDTYHIWNFDKGEKAFVRPKRGFITQGSTTICGSGH